VGDGKGVRRVAVVGVTGSGKTTLAAELARRLDVPHVEIDAIYWGPNWTPLTHEACRERIGALLAGDGWVTDGNYNFLRDITWGRADMLVWLDYGLPLILWRLAGRTLRRLSRREVLWNGNRETWQALFFSRDSLFVWALKSYPKLRKRYTALADEPAYRHLRVVRLRSPRETEHWVRALPQGERRG